MERIISECYHFVKDCKLTYALCGGYALELFTNTKKRNHSDVDITLFKEDRKVAVDYILRKGWDVYEPLHSEDSLRKITDSSDKNVQNIFNIWAMEPNCSFIKIEPKTGEDNRFIFEILDKEQKNFDFMDIIFNTQKDGNFICNNEKNILREIDKAILYHDNLPFLAPEVILYIIADPAYLDSEYHREKNNIDFEDTPYLLSKESMEWLINAIEITYPEGNKRLEQLKNLQQ